MRRLLLALALAVPSPVFAQGGPTASATGIEIPNHDIIGFCSKVIVRHDMGDAIAHNGADPRARAACIKSEQANLELITVLWPNATGWARRESVRYAKQYAESSSYYTSLSSYLESFMRDAEIAQDVEAASH